MAFTPEGVIREARDLSPSYEERAHPNGVMLRALDSYEREVANRVARTYPSLTAEILNVDMPLASFADGVFLEIQDDPQPPDPDAPATRKPIYILPGLSVVGTRGLVNKVPFVNMTLNDRPGDYCGRVGWLNKGRLYLSGTEQTWQGAASLQLTAVMEPKPITTLQTPLQMPDWCHDMYVGQLVKVMSIREGDGTRMAIGQAMVDEVWATVAQQKGAEAFVTPDVWPGNL